MAQAIEWPTFRGPTRTAVSLEIGLLTSWLAAGPKLLWEASGAGRGYSSLAIADGRIYTLGDGTTADDPEEYLLCYDQTDGKFLWKAKTGPAWNDGHPNWQSSHSTPTVDGDRVYAITSRGLLICFDTRGHEIWRKDLTADFNGKSESWGYSESPLVDGDKLVCTPGGEAHTLVALDKRTGKTLWSAARAGNRGAGHASIVVAQVGGTKVYVQVTRSGLMGVRADDGRLLWTYGIDRSISVIATPIVHGELVFFTVGYGRGGALLRQLARDGGEVTIQEVYPLNRELANKHGGVVLVGEYLYGDSEDRGIPFCAQLLTGHVMWKTRGSGRGSASIAAADGHLYLRYADGTMTLAKTSPERLEEVGAFKIPGSGERPSWSHPVILDGKLLLREADKIFCYDLRAAAH